MKFYKLNLSKLTRVNIGPNQQAEKPLLFNKERYSFTGTVLSDFYAKECIGPVFQHL